MGKRWHWLMVASWAVALVAVAVLFQDRLFPNRAAVPTPSVSSEVPPTAEPQAAPEISNARQAGLHKALKAANPDYSGEGKFEEKDGKITIVVLAGTGVTDLRPLHGLPLEALDISHSEVVDLSPLKGLSLHRLGMENTKVVDLTPLAGMPLAELYMNDTPVQDLSPLKGLPIRILNLYGTKVEDLSPLAGMRLESLWLNGTRAKDLSPLRGCPLVSLTAERTPVADLSPLAGGKLERLHIGQSAVTDLTPLKGLPLTRLIFTPGRIKQGLDVARNMQSIREIGPTLDDRMPPKQFWTLYDQGKL